MSRKWWVILGLVALLVVLIVAIPFFVNVDTYRAAIQTQLSKAINRNVQLNDLRLSVLSVAIECSDVRISDDPAFRQDDFVRIQSFRLHLKFWPLLQRKFQVTSLELVGPNIWLVKNAAGVWNFSTLGKTAAPGSQASTANVGPVPDAGTSLSAFNISSLSLKNARVVVLDQAHASDTESYDILDLSASGISSTSAFPFSVTLSGTQVKAPVHLEGEAGPLDANDFANSPAKGTVEAKSFQMGQIGLENLKGEFTLTQGTLHVKPLDFDLYSGHESGTFSYSFQQAKPSLDLTSNLGKVDVNQFLSHATSAKDLFYGLLSGDLSLRTSGKSSTEVLHGMVGRASLDVRNGKLAHISIGHEVAAMAKIVGLSFPQGETPITKMAGHFDIADNWARTNDLQIAIPDLDLLCQGGFSFDNEMKFDVLATFAKDASQKIQSQNPLGGLMTVLLEDKNKQVMIPFQVTGTFQTPHFKLDTQRLLAMRTGKSSGPSNLGDTIQSIQGLFKKKN